MQLALSLQVAFANSANAFAYAEVLKSPSPSHLAYIRLSGSEVSAIFVDVLSSSLARPNTSKDSSTPYEQETLISVYKYILASLAAS